LWTDGDCDRVGTVDDKGNIWLGDMMLVALMRKYLPEYPGATIIVEIKNSEAVVDECKRLGGNPVFSPTGNPIIDLRVREEGAILAGENSGHFLITPDWYVFDDGVFAVCMLLKILSEGNLRYSEYMADIPRYFTTPEYRISCPEDMKEAIVRQMIEYFQNKADNFIDIDGIRGYYEDGWFLIRQSNTQPVISVRAEGLFRCVLRQRQKLVWKR